MVTSVSLGPENPNQEHRDKELMAELARDSEMLLESAIESNLKMTAEERIEAHENALQLMLELRKIGEAFREESQGPA